MRHSTLVSRGRRGLAVGVAAAVVLLGATACGSSSNATRHSDTSSNAAIDEVPAGTFADKPATGSEIKIGIISPEGGPAINQPEGREAAEAVVKYANENLAGIAGHKITTVICKSKEDPASAADCAQQMIDAKVSAVVELNTGQGDAIVPPLVKAGIPYASYQGASGSELTSPGSYLWTGGIAATLASEAKFAARNGVKSLALFATDNAAVVGAVKQMGEPIFGAAGVKFSVVPVPLGTPDVTPQVSAGLKGKPDAVSIVGDATMCGATLKALGTLGSSAAKYIIPFCLEDSAVKNAGEAAYDNSTNFTTADGSSDSDEAKIYRAVMAKYAPGAETVGAAVTGYQSMLGLVRAAQGLTGDPTPANVNTALKAAKDVPLPVGAGITFTCDGTALHGLTAACSSAVLASKVENAKPTTYEIIK
jgi:branched-chain amino acid transport system substrate-binding protein